MSAQTLLDLWTSSYCIRSAAVLVIDKGIWSLASKELQIESDILLSGDTVETKSNLWKHKQDPVEPDIF